MPQFENSLHHVQTGRDPSFRIQSDMTQESRMISVMPEKDRAALEKIFGPANIFAIDNLFDFHVGEDNLRFVHLYVGAPDCVMDGYERPLEIRRVAGGADWALEFVPVCKTARFTAYVRKVVSSITEVRVAGPISPSRRALTISSWIEADALQQSKHGE